MFRKLTNSTIRFFSQYVSSEITPDILDSCLKDVELGLDALFDDRMLDAEDIFIKKPTSPFYYGYALFLYIKAMLSLEREVIDEASLYIQELETTIKKYIPTKKTYDNDLIYHLELLHANCIYMLATLQFLNDSWIDNFKAAYDLRKAFKLYEKLFQAISGMDLEQYCEEKNNNTKKSKQTRRVVSFNDNFSKSYMLDDPTPTIQFSETLKHGVYFGVGLFNIVFLLLPIKVRKVLASLGVDFSKTTVISLLEQSCQSQTMYASLSSLLLLSFYITTSIYIQPKMNQSLPFDHMLLILNRMNAKYPNGKIWKLVQGKFYRLKGDFQTSLRLLKEAKSPIDLSHALDKQGNLRTISIVDFVYFRAFSIHEIGWCHIYAGNYYEASESFFCLESLCDWSRIFYHYIATCCLVAHGAYDKAALEAKQIISMLEARRKGTGKLSVNDQYVEDKVKNWIRCSEAQQVHLSTFLGTQNPILELVYLWNGTSHWGKETGLAIQKKILHHWEHNGIQKTDEPLLCLIMGVIYRDSLENIECAMEYFNLILLQKEKTDGWVLPYAMYEIAATHTMLLKSSDEQDNHVVVIEEWIRCIECYYIENTHDKEWDVRMQLKCQLLVQSCHIR